MVSGWAREQGVEVSLVCAKLLLLVRPPFATPQPRHPLARWRAVCLFCKFASSLARSVLAAQRWRLLRVLLSDAPQPVTRDVGAAFTPTRTCMLGCRACKTCQLFVCASKTLPGRLELPTLRLTASRSSQLSYGSTWICIAGLCDFRAQGLLA